MDNVYEEIMLQSTQEVLKITNDPEYKEKDPKYKAGYIDGFMKGLDVFERMLTNAVDKL